MGTINIYPPIKVPDSKYCFDGKDECNFIVDLNYCEFFDVEGMEVEKNPIRTVKCYECKVYYHEAQKSSSQMARINDNI